MNYSVLAAEIKNDPLTKGYAQFLPASPGRVVEILNAQTESKTKSCMLTERGILSSYGLGPINGAAFLDKLDTLAASGALGTAALKRMMKYVYGDAGIDVGDAATQAALTSLIGSGGVTQAEVDTIKAMALKPASRADVLGLGRVEEFNLREAGIVT